MSTAFEPVAVGHHRETYFALLDALDPLASLTCTSPRARTPS